MHHSAQVTASHERKWLGLLKRPRGLGDRYARPAVVRTKKFPRRDSTCVEAKNVHLSHARGMSRKMRRRRLVSYTTILLRISHPLVGQSMTSEPALNMFVDGRLMV